MEITGYKLRARLLELATDRAVASAQFDAGKFAFKGESKPLAVDAFADYKKAELAIARLQTLQARYNLAIKVNVQGEEITLAEAIKRVGSAGHMHGMWKSMLVQKQDRYAANAGRTRSRDQEWSQPTVSVSDVTRYARDAGKTASALREAISVANATLINFPDIDESMFE